MSNDLGKRFYAWDKNYRLEADLVRCVHCKRGVHFAHSGEPFQHASYCKLSGSDERPWEALALLLVHVAPKDSDAALRMLESWPRSTPPVSDSIGG